VGDCAYRLLLPDGIKNSFICTEFCQKVTRHVSSVVVSKAYQCDAVGSKAKPPKSNGTSDHLI
jgi:hypothetical protein